LAKLSHAEIQHRKTKAIVDIKALAGTLDSEGFDLSDIVIPTPEQDLNVIESMRKRLEAMKDNNQYTNFAEEIMIGAAKVVEYVFDGTQKIPGTNFSPDYTNYSTNLTVKLRGMRYETSQIIGNMVEKSEMGPITKLLVGLLPNFVLYPTVNGTKLQKNTLSKSSVSAAKARTGINTDDARREYNSKQDALDLL